MSIKAVYRDDRRDTNIGSMIEKRRKERVISDVGMMCENGIGWG
jgi:hypothetical protein